MNENSDSFCFGQLIFKSQAITKDGLCPWTSITLLWFMFLQNRTYPTGDSRAEQNFPPASEPAATQVANGPLISWRKMFSGSFYVRVSKSRQVNSFSMTTRSHLMLLQQLKIELFKKWWPFAEKLWSMWWDLRWHFCFIGVWVVFFFWEKKRNCSYRNFLSKLFFQRSFWADF